MNKISGRDLQLLVAGALALDGFRALIWIPYYLMISRDTVRIGSAIIVGLALPIGVAILRGRARAVLWARIYIWLVLISEAISIPILGHFSVGKADRPAWHSAPEMLVSIALLGLLWWSRRQRLAPRQADASRG